MTSDPNDLITFLPDTLRTQVKETIEKYPDTYHVFDSLFQYFSLISDVSIIGESNKRKKLSHNNSQDIAVSSHPSNTTTNTNVTCKSLVSLGEVQFTVKNLSFLQPRKKMDVFIHEHGISLQNGKDGSIESKLALSDLKYNLCLPLPEKQKPTSCIVLIFNDHNHNNNISVIQSQSIPIDASLGVQEQCISFSFEDEQNLSCQLANSMETVTWKKETLLTKLKFALKSKFLCPSKPIFSSSVSTKTLTKYHVACHLKAKESFLFFLNEGVFLGFKKPFLFFPLDQIENMSITGITSRTFDLTVQVERKKGQKETFEFSTIAASEYEPILNYVSKSKNEWRLDSKTGQIGKVSQDEKQRVQGKPISIDDDNGTSVVHVSEDEEEDDDDYYESDSSSVAEEYDSDHDTDGASSVGTNNSEEYDNDDDVEEVINADEDDPIREIDLISDEDNDNDELDELLEED